MAKMHWKAVIAGVCTGVINGFFGGGGGMLLVPLLSRWMKLEQHQAFATSTAVILPISALSALIYYCVGGLDILSALPYLAGGILGGILGGRYFKSMNVVWLRRIFALFVLWAGIRAAFCP